MTDKCFFCHLDTLTADEDDRRAAYFILGQSLPEDETERLALCSLHTMAMVPGLALLASASGQGGTAKRIRAVANVRLVESDAPTERSER